MPRMRTLKPEAASSESLCQVEPAIRWTFAMLWTYQDDEGRGALNPRLIKAAIYPLDDDMTPDVVEHHLKDLERVGCICFYSVSGRNYLHVPAWNEHQHPNRKVPSRIPECPKGDHSPDFHVGLSEDAVSPPGALTPVVVVVDGGEMEMEGRHPERTRTAKRATRIAPDWKPGEDLIDWQRGQGIPDAVARAQLPQFVDYWTAKSGKDATKLDWPATWRNWLRKSWNETGRRPVSREQQHTDDLFDRAARRMGVDQ